MKSIFLSATDVIGLPDLLQVVEKNCLEVSEVGGLYQKIGDLLASNISRLSLDPDTLHISAFARCIAGELITDAGRAIHFPRGCWHAGPWSRFPPFYIQEGSDDGLFLSEIKPLEKQKAAMIHTVAMILRNDPSRQALAEKLLTYEQENSLWTAADEMDID